MLMGEYAVLYGYPCIATALDKRMRVTVQITKEAVFKLNAEDVALFNYQKPIKDLGKGDIPKEAKFVESAVLNFNRIYKINTGISLTTKSEFPSTFGFGSSSAVVVGVIKSLAELLNIKLTQKELFDLSYKTVLDIQGKGSGFDVACAIYGGTIYYTTGGIMIESLPTDGLDLVVGYTGVKKETVSMINLVEEKMKNYPSSVAKIFDNIGNLVEEAKKAILEKDWERLGVLMDYNQNYLEDLGVSTEKISQIIEAAKKAGAYGAKLSGAGGGDCIVALVWQETKGKVEEAIKNAAGEIIDIKIDSRGIKKEGEDKL